MPVADPAALSRRFVLVTALTWLPLGIGMAPMMLLMTFRGIDLATIGLIMVLQSVVVTVLELPTGGLADVIGRRGVLIASAILGLAGFCWLAVATRPWEFVAVVVLRGASRALSSGPAEAWYVDAVQAADRDGDIRRGLAHGQTAMGVSLGCGTLLGGAVPLVVPADAAVPPLAAPMLLSAVCYLALLAAVWRGMAEAPRDTAPPRPASLLRDVPRTIAAGLRLGFRSSALARLLMTFAVLGFALNAVEILTPVRLAELTGDGAEAAAVYGVITAIGFAASAAGAMSSPAVTRLFGDPHRTAVVGTAAGGAGMALLFLTEWVVGMPGVGLIAGCYLVFFLAGGMRGPVQSELIHREVTASERATVVSIQSLLLQGGGAVSSLLLPWLVTMWSIPGALLLSGVALSCSAVLFAAPRHRARREAERSAVSAM